ncbi:class II fructose-bisphosphate aldolase [Micromonospora sp. WMMC241]|uniref:class II fructose-bisphosphate aldolase n=1 Tax=Micromonospora sp. WMMC241 TaxID=3015159 RepID=UPI0022B6E50F|nr:class II fructose-bisphosphate aldolase [Micromonospora sp. WMMC241]MCZ7436820.1 class II fructose-bisphosphate aldolase [Micromonospora sp. WMMC241]
MDLAALLDDGPVVPAFNFNDQFDLAAVVEALNAACRPGILMISMNALSFTDIEFLAEIFAFHRRRSTQPLFIQLDHCADEATLLRAVELNFDLVMADYSHLPVDQNIAHVARVAALVRGGRCLLEAAPTPIPAAGADPGTPTALTSPRDLRQFVGETGCQVAAPHLGTLHGFARGKPPVPRAWVEELVESAPVPLAAHGCDFLAPRQLKTLAAAGVRKLNIGPQLRVAWSAAERGAWDECDPWEPDQRRVHRSAGDAVRAEAHGILTALS